MCVAPLQCPALLNNDKSKGPTEWPCQLSVPGTSQEGGVCLVVTQQKLSGPSYLNLISPLISRLAQKYKSANFFCYESIWIYQPYWSALVHKFTSKFWTFRLSLTHTNPLWTLLVLPVFLLQCCCLPADCNNFIVNSPTLQSAVRCWGVIDCRQAVASLLPLIKVDN